MVTLVIAGIGNFLKFEHCTKRNPLKEKIIIVRI